MKQLKYILASFILSVPVCAFSQQLADPEIYANYKLGNGIATGKSVTDPDPNNIYTLTLETFATGISSVVDATKASDIVLVLDVSGSMDEPYTTTSYVPRVEQGYTGSNYNNNYYYKYEGKYYQVRRVNVSNYGGAYARYVLRFNLGSNSSPRYMYLSGDGTEPTETQPSGVAPTVVIWTGILYEADNTKMGALKAAVLTFIDVVQHNALFDKEGNPRDLDNQISIVKFANDDYYSSESSIEPGNHDGADSELYGNVNSGNYTEVLIGFTSAKTNSGVTSLKNATRSMFEDGGTASHYGLTKAKYLLESVKNRNTNKTVVFFTDGIPCMSYQYEGFNTNFANKAIKAAYNLKFSYGAKVYSVGVFGSLGNYETNVKNYMNYISSNYPDAQDMGNPGQREADSDFFKDASQGGLDGIFEDIAQAASESAATVSAETQVRDVVSSSFHVPSNFHASDVTVYTRDINAQGTAWSTEKHYLDVVEIPSNYDIETIPSKDPAPDYMTDPEKVGVYLNGQTLVILGFEYSKADDKDADGTEAHPYGNWVGWRTKTVNGSTVSTCVGKELVIEFNVEAIEGFTGGDGTNTNVSPTSGVYVATYDDQGNFISYVNQNPYPYPYTDLPITIIIEKTGLLHGESATIQIDRIPRSKTKYDPQTGKPAPDIDNYQWSTFTKVIMTNKGSDGEKVTKTLLSLDPGYVYRLSEDKWGWSYKLDEAVYDTSSKEANPFPFDNTLKGGTVKHAEAVSINHFGADAHAESIKSSKIKR